MAKDKKPFGEPFGQRFADEDDKALLFESFHLSTSCECNLCAKNDVCKHHKAIVSLRDEMPCNCWKLAFTCRLFEPCENNNPKVHYVQPN